MPGPTAGKPKGPLRVEGAEGRRRQAQKHPIAEYQPVLEQYKRDPVEVR